MTLDDRGDTHELDNLKTSCILCNGMKGGSEYKDVKEASESLKVMWQQMRAYYQKNVAPLVPLS